MAPSSRPCQLCSPVQPAAQPHHPPHLVRRQLGEGAPLGIGVARVRQQGSGAQHVALHTEGGTGRDIAGVSSQGPREVCGSRVAARSS